MRVTETRSCLRRGAGFLVLWISVVGGPPVTAAPALAPGCIEAGYARYPGGVADGGSTEEGVVVGLRVPVDDHWFLTASAQRLGAYVDDFGAGRPEEDRRSVGVGYRRGGRYDEMYARLVYIDIVDWRYYNGPQSSGRGGALSVGARGVFADFLEATVEGGLGIVEGRSGGTGSFAGRAELAVRVVPALSAYAAYVVEDDAFLHFGVRLNFGGREARSKPPAVRAAASAAGPMLAAGNSVIAERGLQLQARAAYGAPETVKVPAGETLTLVETLRNEFGNWWRVSWNAQEGWIREGWLKGSE